MARKRKRIKADQLAPKIAAGYTDSPLTPEQAAREFPTQRLPSMGVSHLRNPGMAPVFVAEPGEGGINITRPSEHVGEMQAGYRCYECGERFERAWPARCPVCAFEVSDLQARRMEKDLAGEKHIGSFEELTG